MWITNSILDDFLDAEYQYHQYIYYNSINK
jgi:hypothetical protein